MLQYKQLKKVIFMAVLFFPFVYIQCKESKHPLPRFASMRSNNINTHVGPGKQYPIKWHYRRQFMPVEIIAEFDTWRQIRDIDGAVSWVHVSLLSGKRYALIAKKTQVMRAKPYEDAKIVAKLEPSCVVAIKKIHGTWVYVESRSQNGCFSGWLKNNELWGLYPNETKL